MTEKVLVEHVDGSTSWAVPREKHPAVFSPRILDVMAGELSALVWPGKLVLDPFAGKGLAHRLPSMIAGRKLRTVGVELEPEWAAWSEFGATLVGDATKLPAKWSSRFGAVVTSPCYGNRFADHHDNRDACKRCEGFGTVTTTTADDEFEVVCPVCKGSKLSSRRSYTHDLGRKLTVNNAGAMHYGDAYRALHRAAWVEVERALKPGGLFLLNTKDHVRGGKRIRVSEWHRRTVLKLGFDQVTTILIPQGGLRHGANRTRIPNELVYVFRKPEVD